MDIGSRHESATEALASAVDAAGSQSALARMLGISQNAVSKWVREGKTLPAEHVLKVERETGVSRYALRPDLYPVEAAAEGPGGRETGSTMEPAR